jgi:hypothetical protein
MSVHAYKPMLVLLFAAFPVGCTQDDGRETGEARPTHEVSPAASGSEAAKEAAVPTAEEEAAAARRAEEAEERARRREELSRRALPILQSLYDRARHKNVECEERQSTMDRVVPGIRTDDCAAYPYNGTFGTWGREYTLFVERARWGALSSDDREAVTLFLAGSTRIQQIIVGEVINSSSLPGHLSLTIDATVWERS